jgi:hypothetical protein
MISDKNKTKQIEFIYQPSNLKDLNGNFTIIE